MTNFGAEFIEEAELPLYGGRQYIRIGGDWYLVTEVDQWGRPIAWEPL